MSKHKYSSKIGNEHTAKAVGRDLNISTKNTVMVCNQLRRKNLLVSKKLLNEVIKEKKAIPFTRFNADRGHKTKMGPGRYPIKTAKILLKLLENVEANAQSKGLNTSLLEIVHINAHRASIPKRYGRKGGVNSKRSHVEIIVEEKAESKESKEPNQNKQNKNKKEDKHD